MHALSTLLTSEPTMAVSMRSPSLTWERSSWQQVAHCVTTHDYSLVFTHTLAHTHTHIQTHIHIHIPAHIHTSRLGGDDARVLVWRVAHVTEGKCQPNTMATIHQSNVFSIAFSCDNTIIYSAGNDSDVIKHDFAR